MVESEDLHSIGGYSEVELLLEVTLLGCAVPLLAPSHCLETQNNTHPLSIY